MITMCVHHPRINLEDASRAPKGGKNSCSLDDKCIARANVNKSKDKNANEGGKKLIKQVFHSLACVCHSTCVCM